MEKKRSEGQERKYKVARFKKNPSHTMGRGLNNLTPKMVKAQEAVG